MNNPKQLTPEEIQYVYDYNRWKSLNARKQFDNKVKLFFKQ